MTDESKYPEDIEFPTTPPPLPKKNTITTTATSATDVIWHWAGKHKMFLIVPALAAAIGFVAVFASSGDHPKDKLKDFKTSDFEEGGNAVGEEITEPPAATPVTPKRKTKVVKTAPTEFYGTVTSIVDGDTFKADLNLGFDIHIQTAVRMEGCNAPESEGKTKAQGEASKRKLKVLLENRNVHLVIAKPGKEKEKFGRMLAKTYSIDENGMESDEMCAILIKDGAAKPYFGGKRE